jgi:hypothetical protein
MSLLLALRGTVPNHTYTAPKFAVGAPTMKSSIPSWLKSPARAIAAPNPSPSMPWILNPLAIDEVKVDSTTSPPMPELP